MKKNLVNYFQFSPPICYASKVNICFGLLLKSLFNYRPGFGGNFMSVCQKISPSSEKKLRGPDLNLKIAGFTLQRSFDTHLGLDLAGGSQLVFSGRHELNLG